MARLVEYLNPNPFAVQLIGPDKKTINVPRYSRIVLTDWYIAKYTPRYLKVIKYLNDAEATTVRLARPTKDKPAKSIIPKQPKPEKHKASKIGIPTRAPVRAAPRGYRRNQIRTPGRPIVGHRAKGDANLMYQKLVEDETYPISNNIGIGILSFNRLGSLQRLIESIRKYTDLTKTTIFVSDESTNDEVRDWLAHQSDIVCVLNKTRLGIAGNTNRLLRCLSRFKYKILLNDDVEILHKGWDSFYFEAMEKTGFHHFCYRQTGIYGVTTRYETRSEHKGYKINTVTTKPQGSILSFDEEAFKAVGYFDESFGIYGMEHVDWSNRIAKSKIQSPGYHDLHGSEQYFKIWDEESAIPDRISLYHQSKTVFNKLASIDDRIYVKPTENSIVPSVSYVIPCRDTGSRTSSIPTVVSNIKAQRFPHIEIIVMEQDATARISDAFIMPARHGLVKNMYENQPFCKSAAFNAGVSKASNELLILHDADILVPGWYTSKIFKNLQDHDSCHLGQQVLYLIKQSTIDVNQTRTLNTNKICDHVVDYFEGGSLSIKKSAYIKMGGFDEKFLGYGMEDCEFYQRMKHRTNFIEDRTVKMVHLWHDRTLGWEERHRINKIYFENMQSKCDIDQRCKILREAFSKRYGL